MADELKKQAMEDLRLVLVGKPPKNGSFMVLGNKPHEGIHWFKQDSNLVIVLYWQDLPNPFNPFGDCNSK
jgi:hypothetical protein